MNNNTNPKTFVFFLLAFSFYAIFSTNIGYPIFGSDEYAYFISGKYLDNIQELYKLDPGLQQISNYLYLNYVNIIVKITGYEFTNSYRMLHSAEYIIAAFIMYKTFVNIIDHDSALLGVVAFLMLPSTIFIYAVMPEIELILLAACLGYVLIVFFPRYQYYSSGLAGLLIGVSFLVKPHAVAMLAAAIVTVSMALLTGLVKGGRFTAIRAVLIMIGACYISFVISWRLCSNEWSADPSVALGLKFYGKYLETSIQEISFLNKFLSALHYTLAHISVITLIFSPVLIWFFQKTLALRGGCQVNQEKQPIDGPYFAGLFVLIMLGIHIFMTAWFTAGAAALNEGEAMRLHGRYLGVVIGFLPFLYFHAIKNINTLKLNMARRIFLFAIVVSLIYFISTFKIFPWDYPLLFAFFNASNWYGWNYAGSFHSLGLLLLFLIIVLWVGAIGFNWSLRRVLCYQIFIIITIGLVQNYSWLFAHTKANIHLAENSGALSKILGKSQYSKGMLVSEERYGHASYILYGLANSPKVIIKKSGSVVSANDIAGVDWVLFGNEYVADFDYLDSIAFGPFRFFPLRSDVTVERREKSIIKPGEQVRVSLGVGKHAVANLKGFNSQEEWGAWTSATKSEIVLPLALQGDLKIILFGWTLPENLRQPLVVKIGDVTGGVTLTDSGRQYEIAVSIKHPSDRIILNSSVFLPSDSHRYMGVALSNITIERVKK